MYVKTTSGSVDTFPYSIGQLRRDNPNTSFPRRIPDDMLAEYGIFPVAVDAEPSVDDRTQKLSQDAAPSESGGTWTLGWQVVAKTAEETQTWDDKISAFNRSKRNALLSETDYLALSDSTLSAEMAAYRQALRDISAHANWPSLNEQDWPTKP